MARGHVFEVLPRRRHKVECESADRPARGPRAVRQHSAGPYSQLAARTTAPLLHGQYATLVVKTCKEDLMNPNDPKYDPKRDTQSKPDERQKQPGGGGSDVGQKDPSQRGKENPGNFGNDPGRAREAGEKGGQSR